MGKLLFSSGSHYKRKRSQGFHFTSSSFAAGQTYRMGSKRISVRSQQGGRESRSRLTCAAEWAWPSFISKRESESERTTILKVNRRKIFFATAAPPLRSIRQACGVIKRRVRVLMRGLSERVLKPVPYMGARVHRHSATAVIRPPQNILVERGAKLWKVLGSNAK